MLHSVHDLNPARLNRATSVLQRMQDDPYILERDRQRFDADEPPPTYSSATTTEPPTPTFFTQPSEHEINEIVRQPLTNEELYDFRTQFGAYSAGGRFHKESRIEKERIEFESRKRDEYGRYLYSGPDLIGRAGAERLDVMVRNGVRKRFEKLGVWNNAWGIPGRVNTGSNDNARLWKWKWAKTLYPAKLKDDDKSKWPSREEEGPNTRAIRQLLEDKGQWGDRYGPALAGGDHNPEIAVNPYEALITSRPWFRWELEVEEEGRRLLRTRRSLLWPDYETAGKNAKCRWQAQGFWKDSWQSTPGWKWRHESPSPEPEDPNNMDFSPSEIDALEAIPPPTPPPPLHFEPEPVGDIGDIFAPETIRAWLIRRGEWTANAECQVGDVQDNPHGGDQTTKPSDDEPIYPNRLRKRKRNGEDDAHDGGDPSSIEQSSRTTHRRSKRLRTAHTVQEDRPQPNQQPALRAMDSQEADPEDRIQSHSEHPTAVPMGALRDPEHPGLRRSKRIRERKGTSKCTQYDELKPVTIGRRVDKKPPRPRPRKGAAPEESPNELVAQSVTKPPTGQQRRRISQRRRRKGGVRAK